MFGFRQFLTEAKTRTLYHVTTKNAAASIIKRGFDLSLVRPMWPFDYAVSCCESLRDVRAYSGLSKSSATPILAFDFVGTLATPADVVHAGLGDPLDGHAMTTKTPQQIASAMILAGFDALRYPYSPASLTNSGQPIVYVYNTKIIHNIRLVK